MRQDQDIIDVLEKRHGMPTVVKLGDGRMLPVKNIAYGYDEDSDVAHIATNMRPAEPAIEASLFFTSEIVEILDPATGATIWRRTVDEDGIIT
jgi:hypothetical protein